MAQIYKYAKTCGTYAFHLETDTLLLSYVDPLNSCFRMSGFDLESLRKILYLLENYMMATDRAPVSVECVSPQGIPSLLTARIKHAVFLSNTCRPCRNCLRHSRRSTSCWRLWSYECITSTGMLGYTGKLLLSPSIQEPVLTMTRNVHMSSQKI